MRVLLVLTAVCLVIEMRPVAAAPIRPATCGTFDRSSTMAANAASFYVEFCLPATPPPKAPAFCAQMYANAKLSRDEQLIFLRSCPAYRPETGGARPAGSSVTAQRPLVAATPSGQNSTVQVAAPVTTPPSALTLDISRLPPGARSNQAALNAILGVKSTTGAANNQGASGANDQGGGGANKPGGGGANNQGAGGTTKPGAGGTNNQGGGGANNQGGAANNQVAGGANNQGAGGANNSPSTTDQLNAAAAAVNVAVAVAANATSQQSVAEAEQQQANIKAAVSAHDARIAATQRRYCQFKTNTISFFAQLLTLSRAVKIKDDVSVMTYLAPIPFSRCDNPPSTQIAPIAPFPDVTLPVNVTTTVTFLEEGYDANQGVAIESGDPAKVTVTPHLDAQGKTVATKFDVQGRAPGIATLTARDAWGQTRTFSVTVPTPMPTQMPAPGPVAPTATPAPN